MAWTLPGARRPDLLVGVPHTGNVETEWALYFAQFYSYELPKYMSLYTFSRGAPIDVARNKIAVDAIKQNVKWVFYLDSDNLVPVNAVERLMSHNQPIVGGFYFRRHPPITPTMWRRMPPEVWATGGKYTPIMEFQKNSLVEVDVAGNGLTLVSTRVFEKINPEAVKYIREHGNEPRFDVANCPAFVEKPWFSWKMGREPLGTSEDFEFFSLCQEAGFKIYVDTGCVSPHISQVRFTMDSGQQPPNLLKFGEIEIIFPQM